MVSRAGIAYGAERAKDIERLAQAIAGASTDAVILEAARAAAQAEFDIAQVRQVKVVVIEQMRTVGRFNDPLTTRQTRMSVVPAKAAATMEEEGADEAVGRALPSLVKLDRYERRAEARRRRSLDTIRDRNNEKDNH